MSVEEKERTSGDVARPEPASTAAILPTVNPASEKVEPPKPTFHPAFYIAYVISDKKGIQYRTHELVETVTKMDVTGLGYH